MLSSQGLFAGPGPPTVNKCKTKWVLTVAQSMDFGAFAVDTGGTLTMDSVGSVTETGGAVVDFAASPTTTLSITVDNTVDRAFCGTYPFDLSWNPVPGALTGPGTNMTMSSVTIDEVTIPLSGALPLISITTTSLPITVTVKGILGVTTSQSAGTYINPSFSFDLTQSGTTTSVASTTTAFVYAVLSLTETTSMDFGTVAGGATAGTVILDTVGSRTTTGGAEILALTPVAAALFTLTGDAGARAISVTLDATGAQLDDGVGGSAIPLTNLTNSGLPTDTGTGTQTFNVGATLNLGALQAAGTYSTGSGTPFTVTVNYN